MCLLSLYYSCIHRYINYANLAWGILTCKKKKKIYCQQKHKFRVIDGKGKKEHTKTIRQIKQNIDRVSIKYSE